MWESPARDGTAANFRAGCVAEGVSSSSSGGIIGRLGIVLLPRAAMVTGGGGGRERARLQHFVEMVIRPARDEVAANRGADCPRQCVCSRGCRRRAPRAARCRSWCVAGEAGGGGWRALPTIRDVNCLCYFWLLIAIYVYYYTK